MSNLLKLYEARVKDVDFSTVEALEELLRKDEKTFYFVLMFFYLTKKDLGVKLRNSAILSNCVTLFCSSIQDERISAYYSQYLDLAEIPDQFRKIYRELKTKEQSKDD